MYVIIVTVYRQDLNKSVTNIYGPYDTENKAYYDRKKLYDAFFTTGAKISVKKMIDIRKGATVVID